MHDESLLMDAETVDRTVRRMAMAIVEQTRGARGVGIIGVRRGGIGLARRLAREIESAEKISVPVGAVEIALYRDDAATALPDPKIGPSDVPFDVTGRHVVLVDDVLQTGRTIRAALDCLLDYGRPRRVWLAVLFDRGGRELPVAADFVGQTVTVAAGSTLEVVIGDPDAQDHARVVTPAGAGA